MTKGKTTNQLRFFREKLGFIIFFFPGESELDKDLN